MFELGANLWACIIDLNQQALARIRQIHAVQPWKFTCTKKPLNCKKRIYLLIVSGNDIRTVGFRLESCFLGENGLQASLPVRLTHLEKTIRTCSIWILNITSAFSTTPLRSRPFSFSSSPAPPPSTSTASPGAAWMLLQIFLINKQFFPISNWLYWSTQHY